MLILLLMACQPGTEPIEPYEAVGATAKGPLIQGSSVSIAPIDTSGSPSGDVYPTATRSDLGDCHVHLHGRHVHPPVRGGWHDEPVELDRCEHDAPGVRQVG